MQYLAVIILLFALLPMTAVAQDDVEDERPWSPEVVVSPVKLNVIYRGVDNPIEVAVPGVLCEDLEVSVSHGRVEGTGCRYTVNVGNDAAREFGLVVSWNTRGERKTAERLFRVRDIPDPIICFAGSCKDLDTIPIIDFMVAQGVIARILDFGINITHVVVHCRLQILRECVAVFDGVTNELRLTPEMISALQGVKADDMIYLTDVRVTDPYGSIMEAAPLRLIAK